jgi:hypothetical protein
MGEVVVVDGRPFSAALLERIKAWVAAHPQATRCQLARQVCGWENWRAANGRLKEMSCRKALLELHRRELLELPAARSQVKKFSGVELNSEVLSAMPRLCGQVEEIKSLELVVVRGRCTELSRRWKQMVAAHHYLGYQPLCGAQVRYLIRCEQGEIGALAFSAAALKLKARDRWIGWTPSQRRVHREQVVCNSRFVIAAGVRVKNLASRVLAMALQRLADDWQSFYGVRPVLAETFVERARFAGSCYKAANWLWVGKTSGRGRQDTHKRKEKSIKDIYVHPLCERWKEKLCAALPPSGAEPKADWAAEEFSASALRDRRHQRRLLQLATDFLHQPTASIPQACASAARTKAAYRFLASERVNMEELLHSHTEASAERIAREKPAVVLAVQDSTTFNYSTHPEMEGLGPIGSTEKGPIGVWMHDTMLYDGQGVPLGLLDVQLWSRDAKKLGQRHTRKKRSIEQKESVKWLKSFRAAAVLQRRLAGISTVLSVGDREADVYDLFMLAESDPAHPRLLVRAQSSRALSDEEQTLWPYMEAEPVAAQYTVDLPRRKAHPARQAHIELRFAEITLKPPRKRRKGLGAVKVWAVLAKEIGAPPKEEPLEWMLLTTLRVDTLEQARQCVEYYRLRWGIEQFHRTLKSGCRIEDRRLENRHSWQNCLAIDLVVAWRIEHIKILARQKPEAPPTTAFSEDECRAIQLLFPQHAPSLNLRTITALVAQLGGHLGRKGDGPPGATVLWRGLQRVQDIAIGVRLAQSIPPSGQNACPVSRRPRYG